MTLQSIPNTIKKTAQNVYNDIRTFSLSQKIQNQLDHLSYEKERREYELKKLKRLHNLYQTKSKGIQAIEEHFFNGEPKLHQSELMLALRDEIQRLTKIIESQQELIEKKPFVHGELSLIHQPSLVKSKHPVRFIRNYFKFRKEISNYNKAIDTARKAEFHLTLERNDNELVVERDGTKIYKSEYVQEYSTSLQVGEKVKRFYYLADIPAYLSPYVFFRLLNSSLPFTLSIFVEPSPSSELLKKARQRLSVLEMQQNERIKQGKIRYQQIDKNIEEVMSFIDELVHEAEKGVLYSLYLQLEADDEKELAVLHKQLKM